MARLDNNWTVDQVDADEDEVLGRRPVSRLMRGERVPRIAKAMFLSQSRVRNHLSAIFRKAGVHSQEALLAQLRGQSVVDLPTRA